MIQPFPITCREVASLQYGDIVASAGPPYQVGTVLTFRCDKGFKGKGKLKITCLPNGRWSGPVPYCQVFLCQRDTKRLEPGRTCRKACKSDEDCRGGFKRCVCDDWCGKSCFNPEAECGPLLDPQNGYIVASELSYGYTVTYGCNDGFILVGAETRTCRANRKWSGSQPKCIAFSTCGQPGDVEKALLSGKVIAGTDAKVGAWPWQTMLYHNDDYNAKQIYDRKSVFGGGTVINDKWILSAAHVFYTSFPHIFKNKNFKEKFFLVLGMTVIPDPGAVLPDYVQIYEPTEVLPHPEYNEETFDYDVALVRVGSRLIRKSGKFVVDPTFASGVITYSEFVRPVCLPCMDNIEGKVDIWKNFNKNQCPGKPGVSGRASLLSIIKAGVEVIVTGFGKKRDENDEYEFRPKKLQEGLLKIFADNRCVDSIAKIRQDVPQARFTNRMLCAGSANESLNIDSCQGDSGGPLVQKMLHADFSSYWVQIGIVSWGWGCGNEHPGYYTSVPSIMAWVWEIMDNTRIGIWDPWSSWTKCTVTCGAGQKHRVRTCDYKNCQGTNIESLLCNQQECPKHQWNNWDPWSECTVTCQAGTQERTRTCQGTNCEGRGKEAKICNNVPCIGGIQCPRVDPPSSGRITVVPYPNSFGVGTTVTFSCLPGKFLKGQPSSVTCLGTGDWTDNRRPACVDEWSQWSSWSACTATCNGLRWKARKCNKGNDILGSVLGCKGNTLLYSSCNTGACPSVEKGCSGDAALCVKDMNVDNTNTLASQLSNLLSIFGGRKKK